MAVQEAFHFGLADAKVATWNGVETYGTPLDLKVNNASVEFRTVNGELELDDHIGDVHAKIIAATVTLGFGFDSLQVYEILTGIVRASSTDSESIVIGENNMPYLALTARVDATAGSGALYAFFPKLKAVEAFSLQMRYGQYVIPEVRMTAVYEGTTYGIGKLIRKNTNAAATIPQA